MYFLFDVSKLDFFTEIFLTPPRSLVVSSSSAGLKVAAGKKSCWMIPFLFSSSLYKFLLLNYWRLAGPLFAKKKIPDSVSDSPFVSTGREGPVGARWRRWAGRRSRGSDAAPTSGGLVALPPPPPPADASQSCRRQGGGGERWHHTSSHKSATVGKLGCPTDS